MAERSGNRALAEAALAGALGGGVRLEEASALGSGVQGARSSVRRYAVVDGPSGAPASVVVKRSVTRDGERYEPDSAASAPARRLLNEWAGLVFLREVADEMLRVPRLLAGDRAAGVIVLEDVGEGTGLHEVLQGTDAGAARAALVGYAELLGRLHGRTSGLGSEYDRIRRELGPTLPAGVIESVAAEAVIVPERQATALVRACELVGVTAPADLGGELGMVARSWTSPGPYLAYAHGDPCPDNCLWRDARPSLVDFEFGGFGHALTDAVYGHLLFPSCWCVGRLPDEVQRVMEGAYRRELGKEVPEAAEERTFSRGLVEACAYWATGMCHWAFPAVLEGDERWGTATWRQRVVLRLEVLARACAEAGYLEALGASAGALAAALRGRWAEEEVELPWLGAFRD